MFLIQIYISNFLIKITQKLIKKTKQFYELQDSQIDFKLIFIVISVKYSLAITLILSLKLE